MLSREAVEREEEALRAELGVLPDAARAAAYRDAEKRLRDPDTYATLNWLFITGLHHFYLGRWVRGAIDLGGFCFGVVLIVLGLWPLGLGLIVLISVLELWALARSQVIVQDYNNRVLRGALERARTPDRIL